MQEEGYTGEGDSIREQVIVDIFLQILASHPGNLNLAVEYLLMSSAAGARKSDQVGNNIPIPSY